MLSVLPIVCKLCHTCFLASYFLFRRWRFRLRVGGGRGVESLQFILVDSGIMVDIGTMWSETTCTTQLNQQLNLNFQIICYYQVKSQHLQPFHLDFDIHPPPPPTLHPIYPFKLNLTLHSHTTSVHKCQYLSVAYIIISGKLPDVLLKDFLKLCRSILVCQHLLNKQVFMKQSCSKTAKTNY